MKRQGSRALGTPSPWLVTHLGYGNSLRSFLWRVHSSVCKRNVFLFIFFGTWGVKNIRAWKGRLDKAKRKCSCQNYTLANKAFVNIMLYAFQSARHFYFVCLFIITLWGRKFSIICVLAIVAELGLTSKISYTRDLSMGSFHWCTLVISSVIHLFLPLPSLRESSFLSIFAAMF